MREEEGFSVTGTDLFRCGRDLGRWGKNQLALDMYEWIERQKMTLSASQHGVRLDLIAKTKGLAAAENYFNNLDPCAKDHSTYWRLLKCYCRGLEEDKANALFHQMDHLKLVNSCTPFNDIMALYIDLDQPDKVPEMVHEMKQRNIRLNNVSYGIWLTSQDYKIGYDYAVASMAFDLIPLKKRSCHRTRVIFELKCVIAYGLVYSYSSMSKV